MFVRHRSGGPGVIGVFHLRGESRKVVFQKSPALGQCSGLPKSALGYSPRGVTL
jgi:hypothetical protein